MPNRLCCVCKRLQAVSKKEWGYVNYFGEWTCSSRCLIDWIRDLDFSPSASEAVLKSAVHLGAKIPTFRSRYEEYFSAWLTERRIDWHYERWGFKIGDKKTYTPDWYLPMHGCFLETKGEWGLGQKKKLVMFLQQYPDVTFMVVPWTMHKDFYREDHVVRGVGVR